MPKGSIRSFAHVDGHIYIELRVESILDAILVWGLMSIFDATHPITPHGNLGLVEQLVARLDSRSSSGMSEVEVCTHFARALE